MLFRSERAMLDAGGGYVSDTHAITDKKNDVAGFYVCLGRNGDSEQQGKNEAEAADVAEMCEHVCFLSRSLIKNLTQTGGHGKR